MLPRRGGGAEIQVWRRLESNDGSEWERGEAAYLPTSANIETMLPSMQPSEEADIGENSGECNRCGEDDFELCPSGKSGKIRESWTTPTVPPLSAAPPWTTVLGESVLSS